MEAKCCATCGFADIAAELSTCPECGEPLPDVDTAMFEPSEDDKRLMAAIAKVKLTTAQSLEHCSAYETLEIITAECSFGLHYFRDFFTGITNIFGGRTEQSQYILREARKTCLFELKKEAYQVGANAVIAVTIHHSEFSGKGKSMLLVVASGTAIKMHPGPAKSPTAND